MNESLIALDQLVDQVMEELRKQIPIQEHSQVKMPEALQDRDSSSSPLPNPNTVNRGNYENEVSSIRSSHIPSPKWHAGMDELLASTPSRIGVWRTGTRPLTRTLLSLRNDHAAAIDAVYSEVSTALIEEFELCLVETNYENIETFLRRPDKGRIITDVGVDRIKQRCRNKPQVQIVIADGLSANAITSNLKDVYPSLLNSLQVHGLTVGTPLFVKGGRVGCMNHIGDILQPEVLVMLIGERPGLVSSESMSAYMCYRPQQSTVESDRNVISNIHRGGTPPIEAGAHIGTVLQMMLEQRTSGVKLVM